MKFYEITTVSKPDDMSRSVSQFVMQYVILTCQYQSVFSSGSRGARWNNEKK